ncbi:MAG: adenylyltransferase, partial [Verrucomicrobia bacterium]|nr:adenylyltransferase [Verrucomicrobiota bacterium]
MDRAPEDTVLIPPYGGKLVHLFVHDEERPELLRKANELPSIQLSPRSLCDLELLAVGAFSPLDRFMGCEDHQSVLDGMRMANRFIFPIPVTLPVEPGPDIRLDEEVALRNEKNELLA